MPLFNKFRTVLNWRFIAFSLFALLLLWSSPTLVSNDSLIYMDAGVNENDVIHPHHLSQGLLLVLIKYIGNLFGFADMPFAAMKFAMAVLGVVGGQFFYLTCLNLGIRPFISFCCSAVLLFNGMVWQYAGQLESYNVLTFLLSVSVFTLTEEVLKRKRPDGRQGIPYFSAVLLALATTVHQSAAFTVVGFAAFVIVHSEKKQKFLAAIALAAIAGFLSLGLYVMGWRIASPNQGFIEWMTRYAQTGRWGLIENFSLMGLYTLLMGWGKIWFNFTYEEFYRPLPRKYLPSAIGWFIVFAGSLMIIIVGWLRKKALCKNLLWILAWLIPTQIFTLWWTPFLMNFHSHSMVPFILILAIALELIIPQVSGENLYIKRFFYYGVPFVFPLALIGVNFKVMISHAASYNRGFPERMISSFAEHVGADHLNLLEWDESKVLDIFYKKPGHCLIAQPWKREDWRKIMSQECFSVNIHKSSLNLFKDESSSYPQYENLWSDFLSTLRQQTQNKKPLTGQIVYDGQAQISFINLSNCNDYPMSFDEVIAEISLKLSKSYLHGSKTFFKNLTPEIRHEIFNTAKNTDDEVLRLPPVFDLLQIENTEWKIANDITNLVQESAELKFNCLNSDPYLYTHFKVPRPSYSYSKLRLTASIKSSNSNSAKEDYHFEFFFMLDGHQVDQAQTIMIPWVDSGEQHTVEINLQEYPFLQIKKNWIGLRLDTGAIPDASVTITELKFLK